MADFGFVGPSYEAPSIYQDGQECINFRPEIDPLKGEGKRGVVALYPTPGLTSAIVFQNKQEVRGMRTISGGQLMITVSGPYVYAITATGSYYLLGFLNSTSPIPVIITSLLDLSPTNGTIVFPCSIEASLANVGFC